MHKIIVTTIVGVLASLCATSAAHGDTPRCVSRHEYDRVTVGMTMAKVHTIFDISGTATGLGAPNELRYYRTCTGRGVVQVVFSPKGRVVSKDARFF